MEEEKGTTSAYFVFIYRELATIRQIVRWVDQVPGQLQMLKMDVTFLEAFCLCLESLDYSTDEERNETLRSIITSLTLIWPTEHRRLSLINRLREAWAVDIQDLHSEINEFDLKIQQSKQQIERWCENLLHSPMQCKSSTCAQIRYFLQQLQYILDDFSSYRADNVVPLNKQINLLKAKIVFLDESLKNIERCPCTKEILQFLNFTRGFANKAACLACLYWAKEANEEIATEMDTVLFDMLQEFIPFAYDITPLYVGIVKSSDFGEAAESFVDFFFQHLAITLKDDFLLLRDRLIFLFEFLTDPPCENAEAEDLIRNQINALLREDAYLLLPFDEMKDDFSDKKMLLSDCMIKIDIAIAKMRQLYCGFSDSWIRLQVEKMDYNYFVSVHRELSSIEKRAHTVQGELHLYKMELRFLRVCLLCFTTWDEDDEEIKVRLSSMITSLQGIWETKGEKGLLAPRLHAIRTGNITDWHPLALELQGKIQLSKLEIEKWWINMFHLSFRCKSLTTYKILKFLDSILENINDLVSYKTSEIVLFRKQTETLEEKLVFLRDFLRLTVNCVYGKELEEFKMFVQVFANDAARLIFLYWAKDANDKIASETNSLFSHMLQRFKPATPDVARLYFETLKAIYVQRSDSVMFGQTALSFVDLFFEDPVPSLKDDFRILRDDVLFLLTFLNDHSNENADGLICSHIDVHFWEGLYGLLPFDDMEEDFSKKKKKALLSVFMMKIETVNANIRLVYCRFPDSSLYSFPKVVSPGFLDFLVQNLEILKERMISDRQYVPFAKYKIIKIEEELVSLRPFFNLIFDLKSELSETWSEVVNLVYLTEHVIKSCISSWFVFDHPIWHHMACLSDVFDKIKVVKTKLEKIKESTTYNATCSPSSAGFISTLTEQARPSETIEIVVGFQDEAKKIIDMLTHGSMSLDIVSIVGMGGLGKTTIAKKVYGSSLVKCNFDVFAFCYVSQDHNTRRLLLDILHDIMGYDKKISKMSDDDLAHQLWKCLSRQKYLIVLDDIWNADTWSEIKSSFPNDTNGSRVMFTTRSSKVAEECKIHCTPHQLRFLSEVESWELLQMKVFHDGISPPYLYDIGKLIARNCKGLPLAIAVIAGLLARTEKNLRWWIEVAEKVVSYLSDEGCMKILELSYKHLPENLKPCLLYLGAFPEDRLIKVNHVILLWIAEGFIQESKTKSIEDVAKEYFHDLVDRSLIIVSARSSIGGIKTFHVHDLIHDLCQMKCREENFFQLNHGIASSGSSDPSINNHYRVSTQEQCDVTSATGSPLSNACSLLFFSEKRYTFNSSPMKEFRLAHVLDLDLIWREYDTKQLSSMLHLRYIDARVVKADSIYIPSSISNLWNIGSLMLTSINDSNFHFPESFWRLKSLRHVKVNKCILKFSDGHDEDGAYPILDKVVSFSKPILCTGKDVQRLLQRLPAVRKLSCCLRDCFEYDEEPQDILDFDGELESLKLTQIGRRRPCSIPFPPTLKKLTLVRFELSWMDMAVIAELHCLQVLKLNGISFPEPRLEMEDVAFPNLKYFELYELVLVEWNATTESLPSLEQLTVIQCQRLEDLPSCFEELSTLKKIVIRYSEEALENSALKIKEEQMDQGNEVEVSIYNERRRLDD